MTSENESTCAVDGCTGKPVGRGWCNRHYKRWKAHGDPLATLTPDRGMSREFHFWKQVEKTDGCWLWTGTVSGSGYGNFGWRNPEHGRVDTISAHRFAYQQLVGPIPADRPYLDHLCRQKLCVRAPEHLEPVTPAENNRRHYTLQTHCKHGHEFTEENTKWSVDGTQRVCRACGRRRKQEYESRNASKPEVQLARQLSDAARALTHCPHGHEFTEENTYRPPNRPTIRACQTCRREAVRRYDAKRRGHVPPPS